MIAGYRVVREIARGGMGVVWEVEHAGTGVRYALKAILPSGLADVGLLARFQREAEVGARLDHPNLVRVHAADLQARPPWLVQTLVVGASLAERLGRDGPLPVEAAVRLTAKVARGLAHAHARGVLHRDLKPANVLLDEAGEPRVVDFGVARSLREGTARLTATGEVLGSPAFMAPEQALGERDVDARVDVHALGALLHALLTGDPPFAGRSTMEVLERVIGAPARPPSARRPEVPAAVDAVALRCLEKDPARRYPTADAVAEALEACLAAPPAAARARRPGGVALAAAALGAVAALGAAAALAARGTGRAPAAGASPTGVRAPGSRAPRSRAPGPRAPGATPPATLNLDDGLAASVAAAGTSTFALDDRYDGKHHWLRVVVAAEGRGGGDDPLRLRVGRIVFRTTEPDLSVDTAAPTAQSRALGEASPEAVAHLEATLGSVAVVRVDGAGRVREVTGLPRLSDRARPGALGPVQERLRALVERLGGPGLRTLFESAWHVLPDGPRPGPTWTLADRAFWPAPDFPLVAASCEVAPGGAPGEWALRKTSAGRGPAGPGGRWTGELRDGSLTGGLRVAGGRLVAAWAEAEYRARSMQDLQAEAATGEVRPFVHHRVRIGWAVGERVGAD